MRVMAIDLGTKRIGIALSDPLLITAQGLETYNRTGDDQQDAAYIVNFARAREASTILFGMPRNMNGTYGPQAEFVRQFADVVKEKWQGDIDFFDERLTTMSAERVLITAGVRREKRKTVIDKMAAVVILQGYLDMQRIRGGN